MSRHRNIRNIDEDDYYDDDDGGYYDEDEDYDEDAYYLEQQREKERRQKEEAAKKVKLNQLKQKQQQATNTTTKKIHQQQATNANVTKNNSVGGISIGGGGISVASAGSTKNATKKVVINQPPGFSAAPPTNSASINVKGSETVAIADGSSGGISSSTTVNTTNTIKQSPIPQIPPEILSTLRSLNTNNNNNSTDNSNAKIRSHLSLVIIGHVDAGKSTLTGRLLLSLNHVSQRQYQKHIKSSTDIGKSSFALAWFTDEDDDERQRGVTIDVATKYISTKKYDFTILDAPGHRDFVPNMISGAASADCGLLVVAATTGEFEAGFAKGGANGDEDVGSCCGQTREHVLLSRGLGVTQFVVAVNKLDAADPAWSERRFEEIKSSMTSFLKEVGYREKNITVVPVSGLTGVNVHQKEGKMSEDEREGWIALRKWYKGPTLVEAMDSFNAAKREFEKSLRVIVTDVSSEGKNVNVRGRVARGFVRMGEDVVVLPVGDEANIVRVERGTAAREGGSPYSFGNASASASASVSSSSPLPDKGMADIPELQNCALAGDIVEITLSGIDPARLSPGCVICHPHPSLRPKVKRKVEARVLVMDRLSVPIIRGSQVLLHMHSIDVPAVLTRLLSSKRRGDATPRQNPRVLTGGMTATVEITLSEKTVLEESNECKSLGRFVLRRGGDSIAVG
ncbi:hypothetical protein ACHAXH_004266, partial [Discostella pseudostelligera]